MPTQGFTMLSTSGILGYGFAEESLRIGMSRNPQVIGCDGGSTDPLRASLQKPALEVVGCTTSQADVAKVISSLRRVDGVERVSLSSSHKLEQASASGSSGASDGDCRNGNVHYPQFSMTLFFATPTAPSAAQAAPATTTP